MHNICKSKSCGDDYCTMSTIRKEQTVGDISKIFCLLAFQMLEEHNMQKFEMKALFSAVVDEHIIEEDELE